MSEGRAKEERREFEEKQAKQHQEMQDAQVKRVVADIKKNYDAIKALTPEVNPEAYKAVLFLRSRSRKVRKQWREKLLDPKLSEQERGVLVGQYHAILSVFDMLEQIRALNKELVPGKEEDYIRERFFKRQQPGGAR